MEQLTLPTRKPRTFIGEAFELNSWDDVQPLYEDLVSRFVGNAKELKQWFLDRSELESFLSENMAWRYIKMTCDTGNEERQKD